MTAIIRFVALTVALSWPLWIGAWLLTGRPSTLTTPAMLVAVYAGSFAPGVAAAILSARSGRQVLKAWASGFIHWRCGWRTLAVALLPLPIVMLAMTVALGYRPQLSAMPGLSPALFYLTIFPVAIFNGLATAFMGAGPLGEEGGWRGYLLPRLLETMSEVRASVVLGVIWALWHLPVMALFADWRGGTSLAFYLPVYTIGVVALAYLFTIVWRLGRGSLIACIWLHGLVNALGAVVFEHRLWISRWSTEASTVHFLVAFWVVAAVVYGVRRAVEVRHGKAMPSVLA